jgi:hypothetical protein
MFNLYMGIIAVTTIAFILLGCAFGLFSQSKHDSINKDAALILLFISVASALIAVDVKLVTMVFINELLKVLPQ